MHLHDQRSKSVQPLNEIITSKQPVVHMKRLNSSYGKAQEFSVFMKCLPESSSGADAGCHDVGA
jgi:hypothetical protein